MNTSIFFEFNSLILAYASVILKWVIIYLFLIQPASFSFLKKAKMEMDVLFTYVNQRDDMLCHMERLQP